jgi:predicted acyltransferase
MGGVVTSCLYKSHQQQGHRKVLTTFLILGAIMLLYGFLIRPYGGISKIRATPSWIGICTGISLITYAFLYWLADVRNKTSWAKIIGPAGKSTLTCYLVPYIYYAIWSIWAVTLPVFIRTGILGLIKSMLFALLIVAITGVLNRWKISLKI